MRHSKFLTSIVILTLLATLLGSAGYPTSVSVAVTYIAVSAGGSFTCGLTAGGSVKCWGSNSNGQLGDGTTTDRKIPVQVYGLTTGVTAISAGFGHACVIKSGSLKCWGSNFNGQLGDNTTFDRKKPVQVIGMKIGVSSIAAGGWHTCAVKSNGLKCWGANWSGQLGDGTWIDKHIPVQVSGLTSGVSTVATGHMHSCALRKSRAAKCWGANWSGQLGNGTTNDSEIAVPVKNLSEIKAITIGSGGFYTCARTSSNRAKCWGENYYGQLGDGTKIDRKIPVQVYSLASGVSAISAGSGHTCAIKSGSVKCWGSNSNGQLGNGTTTDKLKPIQVTKLNSGVAAISSGDNHSCALTTLGKIMCWGSNYNGQLGDGTKTDRHTPVNVVN